MNLRNRDTAWLPIETNTKEGAPNLSLSEMWRLVCYYLLLFYGVGAQFIHTECLETCIGDAVALTVTLNEPENYELVGFNTSLAHVLVLNATAEQELSGRLDCTDIALHSQTLSQLTVLVPRTKTLIKNLTEYRLRAHLPVTIQTRGPVAQAFTVTDQSATVEFRHEGCRQTASSAAAASFIVGMIMLALCVCLIAWLIFAFWPEGGKGKQ